MVWMKTDILDVTQCKSVCSDYSPLHHVLEDLNEESDPCGLGTELLCLIDMNVGLQRVTQQLF